MKLAMPTLRFSSAKGSVGLVIRSEEVQLLSMEGKKIVHQVRVPIEGKGDEHLIRAIQQAVASASFKTKRLAVAVPMQDVLIRFFTMPEIPKAEWDMAVQFEARKYIPFKTESLIWDYHVIRHLAAASRPAASEEAQPGRMEVVFAGIPTETFHRFQTALTAAGIQPTAIEPFSLSLARLAASATADSPTSFVCLVDIERERAHLVIARQGIPYLTRDVSLSWEESGADAGGTREPAESRRVQRLLSELRVSMDFFTREYPAAVIRNVMLFGEPEAIGPRDQWPAGQLQSPLESGSSVLGDRVEGELPLSFASAVGLLRAGLDRTEPALNFLKRQADSGSPPQRMPARAAAEGLLARVKGPETRFFAALAVGGLLACWLLGAQQVSSVQRRLDRLVQARPEIGWGLEGTPRKELTPISEGAQQQLNLLQSLAGRRESLAAKLDALARALPDGVWLTRLTFDDKPDLSGKAQARLTVHGACFLGASGQELSAIQEFETRVKHDPALISGFSTAQLEQVSAQVDNERQAAYRTFQLNCRSGRRL